MQLQGSPADHDWLAHMSNLVVMFDLMGGHSIRQLLPQNETMSAGSITKEASTSKHREVPVPLSARHVVNHACS